MKLYIKNMVCSRCKTVVRLELEKLGFHPLDVVLGEVEIKEEVNKEQKQNINTKLSAHGFELIEDKKARLIEKIKNAVVELVHYTIDQPKVNLSDYLSKSLNQDYSYLSKLFSDIEGTTIEQYLIAQKIEKVKEWLVYDELSLSAIANQMNYSDVAHLSRQFKKVTGLTPSHFKRIKENKRKPLEEI
jgi:YesN/AraC family two-component response regulator